MVQFSISYDNEVSYVLMSSICFLVFVGYGNVIFLKLKQLLVAAGRNSFDNQHDNVVSKGILLR